jgi:hypothetical protein
MGTVADWRFHVEEGDFTAPMDLGAEGGSNDRLLQLGFVAGSPEDTWPAVREYAAGVEATGLGAVTFAAPFFSTIVGTDRYTDELW